jgi:hypothetical protein
MDFCIWVETHLAGSILERHNIATVERRTSEVASEEFGLSLEEGKSLIRQVQARIVQTQTDVVGASERAYILCGRNQRVKDIRSRCIRTVFGRIDVTCRRYTRCRCRGAERKSLWPLSRGRLLGTTPELQYLHATWGSRLPYRKAAALLKDLLPVSTEGVSHATVRRHTLAVGARLDQRITEPDEYDWPESGREAVSPADQLTVAIDGTYVRANRIMGLGEHHVVAGRVERDGFLAGSFAWVTQYPLCDDLAYMKAALETNGWTPESRVTVLADGADGLNNLVCAATEKATRKILDWFHISMRLRPIEQMSKSMAVVVARTQAVSLKELLETKLPNVRHQMWNGRWHAALDRMGDLYRASARLQNSSPPSEAERVQRFRKHLVNLRDYLCSNWSGLTNYARDHHEGMRISSAPAESAMSHLVNQRMGKRQPMRWSSEGPHLLLQVRCAVLDNRLDALFREKHTQFRTTAFPHYL